MTASKSPDLKSLNTTHMGDNVADNASTVNVNANIQAQANSTAKDANGDSNSKAPLGK